MIIYKKEVDFKISKLKHAAAMQKALADMGKTEAKIQKARKQDLVEALTMMLDMFRQFFVTATGEDVLADCDDFEEAQEAYYQFLADIKNQKTAMLAPYSPDSIQ